MQGRNVLAKDYAKRDAVFAARDRCDETIEHIRSVRTERFKYIRNYLPERPHLQPNRYKDDKAIVQKLRELHAAGKLDDAAGEAAVRPDAAGGGAVRPGRRPARGEQPRRPTRSTRPRSTAMRKKLADWEERTGDRGRKPEPMAMYDSDMKVYLRRGEEGRERRAAAEHRAEQEVGERGQVTQFARRRRGTTGRIGR